MDNAVLLDREPNRNPYLGTKETILLEGLRESFSSPGKAVIVPGYHIPTLERLRFVLEHAVGKLGFNRLLTLQAEDSTEERVKVEREFLAGDLLLMSSAGAESQSLSASDEIWLYNTPWSARLAAGGREDNEAGFPL